jgi:hypothetical protein
LRRSDDQLFSWQQVDAFVTRLLSFVSFANGSLVPAPVIFGYNDSATVEFYRFITPPRTLPVNRRSWSTGVDVTSLQEALRLFLSVSENSFWASILDRAIEWQSQSEAAQYDSTEQALFVMQTLLEMLSYVVLVEDSQILSEDGYGKLPAADRITLLCGQTGQPISLPNASQKFQTFCSGNKIHNVGELIATLRNKLVHPTKKNREYLERVPKGVRPFALISGLQIASLTVLKILGYRNEYFDTISRERRLVPWA